MPPNSLTLLPLSMNSTKKYCDFYIVRHVQTVLNASKRYQGHADSPLTVKGIMQGRSLQKEFSKIDFAIAYTSDLARSTRTLELIIRDRSIPIKITSRLRERTFGSREGTAMDPDELNRIFQHMPSDQHFLYKMSSEYKSDKELSDNLIQFMKNTARKYTGKNILAVTHGGLIKAYLIALKFADYRDLAHGGVDNGAYIKVRVRSSNFEILKTSGIRIGRN